MAFLCWCAVKPKQTKTRTREAERYKKRLQRCNQTDVNSPRTKTKLHLKGQKVHSETRKVLLFHNVLVESLRNKYNDAKTNKDKRQLDKVVISSLLKKYRLQKVAQAALGLNNKKLSKPLNKILLGKRERGLQHLRNSVADFLCRDDNSRVKAGKRATKTQKKEKRQIRLLTDSLTTLHLKYKSENVNSKISYALFCRLKPFYVRHPKASDRETCLCKRHENLKFKAIKLKQLSLIKTADLDENAKSVVCGRHIKKCMYRECNECQDKKVDIVGQYEEGTLTEWYEWKTKRVERQEHDNRTKTVTMTLKQKEKGTIDNLISEFNEELNKCCSHLYNISHQFLALRALKEKLTNKDILLHIDFSENYGCKYNAEIQSMHFGASQRQVSLHTGVMYTKDHTESFCSISDNLKHGPAGIWAHLCPVLKHAQAKYPEIENVFFVSDGPTTQYRCKDNFYTLCTQPFEMGFKSVNWSFMEAGHGKGAPDGIGAVVKRAADSAVLYGREITDAESMKDAIKGVSTSLFVIDDEAFDEQDRKLPKGIQTVAGTMKIHQLFSREENLIHYRELSCFCSFPNHCECFSPKVHQFTPTVETNSISPTPQESNEYQTTQTNSKTGDITHFDESFIGQYCVVTYDDKPYPGTIQDVTDGEIEVNVMHSVERNKFFWPRMQDVCLYSAENFVTLIPEPTKIGTRHYQIEQSVWSDIENKLDI